MAIFLTFGALVLFVFLAGWLATPVSSTHLAAKASLSGLFGFLALTQVTTLLLFTGLFTPLSLTIGVFGLLVPVLLLPKFLKPINPVCSVSPAPIPLLERCLLAAVAAVLIHTLLGALTPEVRSDPLRYHLRLAQQYALRGGIEPLRENPWWAIPQYAESLYALGILLANDTLAKLIHWFAGLLSFMAVFAFTSCRFGTREACWAVFLWAMTPKISYEMTTTYVEMILTVWTFGAVLFGFLALSTEHQKHAVWYLVVSGFFLGMAFGTKYTSLAVQGLPWFVFPAAFLFRNEIPLKSRLLSIILAGLAILLADSPWLIRNLHQTGNPLYPLYNHLIGPSDPVDKGIENFFLTVWPGAALLTPRFYLERILGLLHSGYSFPALVILLPLLLRLISSAPSSRHRLSRADRTVLLFCAFSFAAYLIFTGNMDGRFYIPTLSILVCYLGQMFPRLLEGLSNGAAAARLVGPAMAVLFLFNYSAQRVAFFEHFNESPWPILSEEARWDYYAAHEVGEPEGSFWETAIPEGTFVYNLGFPHRFKSIHPLSEGSVDRTTDPPTVLPTHIDPVLTPFEASEQTLSDLEAVVEKAGVDYLLAPADPHRRETRFWSLALEHYPPVPGTRERLLAVR